MEKPFEERNQTDAAKRQLKALATATGIDIELVTGLANFTWDYDPDFGNEATGWVKNERLQAVAEKQLGRIAEFLGLQPDFQLLRERARSELISAHGHRVVENLWSNFCAAAASKDYSRVSEFASYHYLRGLSATTVDFLAWTPKTVGMVEIARNLFMKLFRGGAVERHELAYLWCDLVIELGSFAHPSKALEPWIEPLLDSIESLPPGSGLKDLITCCKGLVSGDKGFKQEVLQALAYADVLRVNQLPVETLFIDERRDELSPHFYSNEWTFPLRFWAVNGGAVNRAALVLPDHSGTG